MDYASLATVSRSDSQKIIVLMILQRKHANKVLQLSVICLFCVRLQLSMWQSINVAFVPRTESADEWQREKEMFRLRATGPDWRGAEAFLKTSGKEFKCDRKKWTSVSAVWGAFQPLQVVWELRGFFRSHLCRFSARKSSLSRICPRMCFWT